MQELNSYNEYNDQTENKFTNQKLAAFIVYLLSMTFLPIFISIPMFIILGEDHPMISPLLNFGIYFIMVVAFVLLLWKYYASEWSKFKSKALTYTGFAIAFWGIGFILNIIISMILTIFGIEGEVENQIAIEQSVRQAFYLMIPMTVLFAPFVEETIFRGIIFEFFYKLKLPNKLNVILAFVMSTGIFASIHFIAELVSGGQLLLGLPYVVLGFIICLVYYLTRSVYAAMITHLIQNFISMMLLLILIFFEDYFDVENLTYIIDFLMQLLHLK